MAFVTAVTPGVPDQFDIRRGVLSTPLVFTGPTGANYNRGTLVKRAGTSPPTCVLAGGSDVDIVGLLGEDFTDPALIPSTIAKQSWGVGMLNSQFIPAVATVWKQGSFHVTNVSGSVAQGDFLRATTGGLFISTTTTNSILNGFIVCTIGNAASAGPIDVEMNLV